MDIGDVQNKISNNAVDIGTNAVDIGLNADLIGGNKVCSYYVLK